MNHPGTRLTTVFGILPLTLFFLAWSAHAQDDTTRLADSREVKQATLPHLFGHYFMPSSIITSPFVNTRLQMNTGYGRSLAFRLPTIMVGGREIVTVRGELLFLTMTVQYQQQIKDWMAVFGSFDMSGRLGDGVQSLLSQGINATSSFQLGWMFRLHQSDRMMLSAKVGVNNGEVTIIDVRDFVERVIADGGVLPYNTLVKTTPLLSTSAGLAAAYAINPAFGLALSAEAGVSESLDRTDENRVFYVLALGVDADLLPGSHVPIGFGIAGRVASFTRAAEELDSPVYGSMLKVAYTGSSDYSIGLEWRVERQDQIDLVDPLVYQSFALTTAYYF